jgi:hypothetical protein
MSELREKFEHTKDEKIEEVLEQIAKTGEKRFVNTSIYSDEDIRNFLYYSSRILKSPELSIELQYLVNQVGSSKMNEDYPSVFDYQEIAKEKLVLASWYSGEKEEDAFRRTETHYIINEPKKINAIVTFRDEKISKDFLYLLVSGRFASADEKSLPVFWEPVRVHCTCLRDIILYILSDDDNKKLGIEFQANTDAVSESK